MSTDFIPSRDADGIRSMGSELQDVDFGVAHQLRLAVAGDATVISASYGAWHAAYLAATTLGTRTHVTIAAKDAQKILTVDVVRTYSTTIRANTGVGDSLKVGLGLNLHDTIPTPVPPPSTYPVLRLSISSPLTQDVLATDSLTPTRRAKPHGAAGLLVFRAIGTTAATDPETVPFLAFVTKSEITASFASADDGKIAGLPSPAGPTPRARSGRGAPRCRCGSRRKGQSGM